MKGVERCALCDGPVHEGIYMDLCEDCGEVEVNWPKVYVKTRKGSVLWAIVETRDDGHHTLTVTDTWMSRGCWKVPVMDQTDPFFNLHILEVAVALGIKICSRCGKVTDKIVASHFAGHYCKECWEDYKGENKGTCLLCGSPYYSCHC